MRSTTRSSRRFRERYGLTDAHLLKASSRGAASMQVVVVGDYVLDRYHFCDASGVAGEGPMMSLRSLQRKDLRRRRRRRSRCTWRGSARRRRWSRRWRTTSVAAGGTAAAGRRALTCRRSAAPADRRQAPLPRRPDEALQSRRGRRGAAGFAARGDAGRADPRGGRGRRGGHLRRLRLRRDHRPACSTA